MAATVRSLPSGEGGSISLMHSTLAQRLYFPLAKVASTIGLHPLKRLVLWYIFYHEWIPYHATIFEYIYEWWRGNSYVRPLPTIDSAFQCAKVVCLIPFYLPTCRIHMHSDSECFFLAWKGFNKNFTIMKRYLKFNSFKFSFLGMVTRELIKWQTEYEYKR